MKGGANKILFLDANVLLNIIQNKANKSDLQQVIASYDFIYTSNFSEFFAYSFCVYTKFNTGKDYFDELKQLVDNLLIKDINSQVMQSAKSILKGKDFEDAIQVATAIYNKCDCILTSDKEMYESYSNLIEIVYVPRK